ncbi:protein WVD2-like 7 isoform X4 [Canna indica]|uniref:Protein WVD2-like 7 isoform X4 n=1 Tax=Canna indica TaxID=4628 RepID=A0AAQ3JW64_9LILI|nr:protein WVD2-like 7 isoform X4 [Canna indica]
MLQTRHNNKWPQGHMDSTRAQHRASRVKALWSPIRRRLTREWTKSPPQDPTAQHGHLPISADRTVIFPRPHLAPASFTVSPNLSPSLQSPLSILIVLSSLHHFCLLFLSLPLSLFEVLEVFCSLAAPIPPPCARIPALLFGSLSIPTSEKKRKDMLKADICFLYMLATGPQVLFLGQEQEKGRTISTFSLTEKGMDHDLRTRERDAANFTRSKMGVCVAICEEKKNREENGACSFPSIVAQPLPLTSNQMATDLDQAYERWSQEELSDGDESHDISASQMLDGSISFGRFPIESLSWERRSVFTHNRCQEELEKFNGLVAKKKAYFEERYRRIRAMKAQQNQQIVLTLDYSGDGSISSQSGDEGVVANQHDSLGDGAENVSHSSPKDVKAGTAFQQEAHCNESLQERCSVESTLPNLTSSSGILDSIEQDKNSIGNVFVPPLETESSIPLTTDMEEIESNYSSNIDNIEVSCIHENLVVDLDPRRVTQGTQLDSSNTNLPQLQSIRKSLVDKPLSNVKEPASVGNVANIKGETKVKMVRSSKGLRASPQKMVSQTLNTTTTSRIKNKAMPILVASNRQHVESRPNKSNPGPFTLVMERRANSRGTSANLDSKGSKMLVGSQSHAKGNLTLQEMTKKTAINTGATRGGLEIKRDLKEVRNKPFAVHSPITSLKKTDAHVTRPSKSRSLNLPARTKFTSNARTESQIATAKQREGNAKMREFQRITTKTSTPPSYQKMRTETTKPLAARDNDVSRSVRKSKLDNLSLDGRKTRREIPYWR